MSLQITGKNVAAPGGLLHINTTASGTSAGTSVEDLMIWTLPANTLYKDGMGIRMKAWGTTGANANNKTFWLYLGGSAISAAGPVAWNDKDWMVTAEVYRTGVGGQAKIVWHSIDNEADSVQIVDLTLDETLALSVNLKAQNGTAAANDVVCEGMTVELITQDAPGAVVLTGNRMLNIDTAEVGTDADTSAKDLMTYSLPANTLYKNGMGVRVKAWGSTGANANDKTLTFLVGGIGIFAPAAHASNNLDWEIETIIYRDAVGAQKTATKGWRGPSLMNTVNADLSQDETAAIAIIMRGQNGTAAANDVVCEGMTVELLSEDPGGVPPAGNRMLSVQNTAVGTDADTSLKTLQSFTLPADTLNSNGKGVKIRAWGTSSANANDKTLKFYFGAAIFDSGVLAMNNQNWIFEGIVHRTGVGTQDRHNIMFKASSIVSTGFGTLTEDETTDIVIAAKGQNGTAAANDIVCEGMSVELLNN